VSVGPYRWLGATPSEGRRVGLKQGGAHPRGNVTSRGNVTGRRNESRLRRMNLCSNAKEYAMKMLTTGIIAAATLLSAAPAFAIEVDVGPNGIRVGPRDRALGPRDREHGERYFRDRPDYRNSADCRKITVDRPDGSRVVKYRCD
jgi:hypothetical protein